ncbi:MAG: 30S ribosomal protein S18 [Methylacidiphilales bacterium]|nr:30S ribosomal protein S18 [Candidatus Methylacidiphilales bacterium]MDW8349601.1 30S ribosomal protein S18 [Verrucomicrobiae bacterium]
MSVNKNKKNLRKAPKPRRVARKRRIDINAEAIDILNTELLKKFTTENGRILPRRVTGMPLRLHRKLTREIKRARTLLLLK